MKSSQRQTAAAVGIFALSLTSAPLLAQANRNQEPPQRGSPPGQDTPYILVTTFFASDRQLAVQAADELRRRLQQEHSAKELFVVTKNSINSTLEASGYRPDSALNTSDLMELAKQLRGEYVIEGKVAKTGQGNAVKMEARILMKTGQQVVAQPIGAVDAKDVGDGVKQIEKSISDALKQIPMYKNCVASLRAAKYTDAVTQARAGVAAYPNAAWSRVCLLNAYGLEKSTPPDSIISVANQVLAVDPTSMLALSNLAEAYKAKGDKDKAIETNLRIYRADPSNSSIAQSIVQELAQSGAPDKALPIIDSLISSNPGDPNMLKTKWLLQLRASKFKAAIATGEELVKIDTAAATLDYYQRQIGAAQSDSNSAKITELASKASQKFPKEVSFPMLLSQTYYRAGQLQQALDAANKATAIDPKDVRGWQLAMVAAKDMNRPDSVLAIGQRALAAGADKAQIGPMMLAPVSAAVKKAQELKTRDSWKEALAAAEMVDGIAPTAESKFYIGVAAFQTAADILGDVQTLAKSTKPADKAQACTLAKEGEDYLTKVSVAMPQGGKVDAQVAGQILGNVGNYTEFIAQVKKAFCK